MNAQATIPLQTQKVKFTDLSEAAVVVRKNGKVLLRQCAADERWAGLWDFPRFELDSEGPLFVHDELIAKVKAQTGVSIKPGALLNTIKHGVTRYRITLDCYEAEFTAGKLRTSATKTLRWCPSGELQQVPLSTTGRKLAKLIRDHEMAT